MYDFSFVSQVMRKIDLYPVGAKRERSLKLIRKVIKDGNVWNTSKIAKKTGLSDGCVAACLKQLRSYGEVEIVGITPTTNAVLWQLSREDAP